MTSYGCVQHIERGEFCGPDCEAMTRQWNAVELYRINDAVRALLADLGVDEPEEGEAADRFDGLVDDVTHSIADSIRVYEEARS